MPQNGSQNSEPGIAPRPTSDPARDSERSYKRLVKQYRVEVAASASSVLSTVTAFPLDSVKTRMQTYKYSGFLDCVRQTYKTEKLRGFFRGWFPFFLSLIFGCPRILVLPTFSSAPPLHGTC